MAEQEFHNIKIGDDWTVPEENGIGRRTIVSGAVWSVPVVAAAASAPLAAASTNPELTIEFDQPAYFGVTCDTLDDITITVKRDGVAAANEPVVVTLPAGLAFSDGSTTRSFTTDGTGRVVLTGANAVTASSSEATYTIGASSGTATAAAQVEVANEGTRTFSWTVGEPGTATRNGTIKNGVALEGARGLGAVLTSTGDITTATGIVLASNVVSYQAFYDPDYAGGAQTRIVYVTSAGAVSIYNAKDQTYTTGGSVPNATKVDGEHGLTMVLDANGGLFTGNGIPIDSGVKTFEVFRDQPSGQARVVYVKNDGSVWLYQYDSSTGVYESFPANNPPYADPVKVDGERGMSMVLDASGNLFVSGQSTPKATDVVDFEVFWDYTTNSARAYYVTSSGASYVVDGPTATPTAAATVPGGEKVDMSRGLGAVLTSDGKLINGDGTPIPGSTNGEVIDFEVFWDPTANASRVFYLQKVQSNC